MSFYIYIYGICTIIFCISLGFLVTLLIKKNKETNEDKKKELSEGITTSSGFIGISILSFCFFGYLQYREKYKEELLISYKTQIMNTKDEDKIHELCGNLYGALSDYGYNRYMDMKKELGSSAAIERCKNLRI
jgi:c-di-AMP phosphodiesterase-like protein